MGTTVNGSIGAIFAMPIALIVGVLGIVLFGVLPIMIGIGKTEASIQKLEGDIAEQEALIPIYLPLVSQKEITLPAEVVVREVEPLQVDDLAGLPLVFQGLANKAEVDLQSVNPQVRSFQGGREILRIDTALRGNFVNFKKFLNLVNEMESVDSFQFFAIDVTDSGHEMKLSIWLAIQ